MTSIWTPEHALVLAAIAMVIAFLVGGEILEAVRSRRPVHARSDSPKPKGQRRRRPPTAALRRSGLD